MENNAGTEGGKLKEKNEKKPNKNTVTESVTTIETNIRN
jgi:hypothetical protein